MSAHTGKPPHSDTPMILTTRKVSTGTLVITGIFNAIIVVEKQDWVSTCPCHPAYWLALVQIWHSNICSDREYSDSFCLPGSSHTSLHLMCVSVHQNSFLHTELSLIDLVQSKCNDNASVSNIWHKCFILLLLLRGDVQPNQGILEFKDPWWTQSQIRPWYSAP